jgi:sec-independent protein translocase protein TatC
MVVLGMGLVFELPMFILALVRLRILSAEKLRRNRRIGIFLVVLAAVLLPTVDPISLAFETVPLLILFELSIWLAVVMERRWERSYGEAIDVT